MKKLIYKYLCLAALLHIFPAGPASAKPLEILLAYENTSLPPYYLGDAENIPEDPGIAVELLILLDDRLPEVRFVFRRDPWKRCQKHLGAGQVDAIFPASFKAERQKIGVYPITGNDLDTSCAIVRLSYFLYTRTPERIGWNGRELASDGAIGAPTSYSIVGDLKKRGLIVDDSAPTTKQNLSKLRLGRVAAVAAQDCTADPIIAADERLRKIVKIYPPLKTRHNYLMFSHRFMDRHPELARRIWTTLRSVREQYGEALTRKYMN